MEKNDIRKILHRLDLERRQLMRPRFLEMGLTVGEGQPRILNCLLEQGEMSQRELADACMFDVTTLSRTLDKMEKAGLVTRKVNPASRRAHLIALTPEGKKKSRTGTGTVCLAGSGPLGRYRRKRDGEPVQDS